MDPLAAITGTFDSLLREAIDHPEHRSKSVAISAYQNSDRARSERKELLRVSEVMKSPVITLTADASDVAAERLMKKHGFRHLPVLTSSGALIGIVSERDLLRSQARIEIGPRAVRDLMSVGVETIAETTFVREAARKLVDHRIGALPVISASGELRGILTRTDILRAIVERAPVELWG